MWHMRKFILFVALSAMVVACRHDFEEGVNNETAHTAKIIGTPDCAMRGSILVKLNSYASQYEVECEGLDIEARPIFPTGRATEESLRSEEIYRWWILTFDESADLEGVAHTLAGDSRVAIVEYDAIMEHLGEEYSGEEAGGHLATRATSENMPFNDEYLPEQWHYYNDCSLHAGNDYPFAEGADINLFPAWKYSTGDRRVIVAVIDGGVKYDHPDLAANMWVNEAEMNGKPGIDDDGNKYTDDIYGYNFYDDNGNITSDNHGTHVAGTIAAVSNNGIGVAGVAGGSGKGDGCRIMTCQIYKNGESASAYNIARAITYAADNGAVIINNSWAYAKGSYVSDQSFASIYSVLIDAITYFKNNAKLDGVIDGGIALFAAGNDGYGVPSYPGAYYDNICVTSFASDFRASTFTNYGAGANICAPGGENGMPGTGWMHKICSTSATPYEYNYDVGTSMATPHVSGCAALGLSYALELGKSFTREEFKALILSSVHDINRYQTGTKVTLYDTIDLSRYVNNLGSGYIDAHRLLMQIEGTPCLYIAANGYEQLSLDNYFGDSSSSLTYTSVEMSAEDMAAIGISSAPTIEKGKLKVRATKRGCGRIRVTAIVGGTSVGGGNNMGGMEVSREFELVVRNSVASNGGWL